MNQLKIVAAGGAALALSIIVALAQGSDGKLAARSPPAGLEPYADATLVMQNARRVIGLLGTATFDVQASEQRSRVQFRSGAVMQPRVLACPLGFNMFPRASPKL